MSWKAVAWKDFHDAVRSWWLWGLTALFLVFFTVPAYFLSREIGGFFAAEGAELSADVFIGILADINAFFIPIIAIILTYAAISGERDSGSLKLLLSLPHSRRDVVFGKLVGRGAVVTIPVVIGFVAAAIIFIATPVTLEPLNYLLFIFLTVILGLIFVSIAVGISAASLTSKRAMIGTVGLFVVFTLFWRQFAQGLVALLGEYTSIEQETLFWTELLVLIINPTHTYKQLAGSIYFENSFTARLTIGFPQIDLMFIDALREELAPLPIVFTDYALLVILAAWLLLPAALGYLVFRNQDL